MEFYNKELCQNLGELVMMKVAGELDNDQYEACTEYMLKEANALLGAGRAIGRAAIRKRPQGMGAVATPGVANVADDAAEAVASNFDIRNLLNAGLDYFNRGVNGAIAGAKQLRGLTDDGKAILDNTKAIGNGVREFAETVGVKPKYNGLTLGKALGVGGATGVGAFGLANLLSAAGKANAYDPYEY